MILPNLSTHFAFLCLVWLWLSHEDWIHDNIYWDCRYCLWNAFLFAGKFDRWSYHVIYVFKSTMDSKRQMDLDKWDNNFGSWNRN